MKKIGRFSRNAAFAAFLLGAALNAGAQTIVATARLGHNQEDITYVDSGLWAGKVAIVDGFDMMAVNPGANHSDLMFHVTGFSSTFAPRGVTYHSPSGKFYFCDTTVPNQLFVTDETGAPQTVVPIAFTPGDEGFSCEGLSSIPLTAAQYPGDLVFVDSDNNGNPRVLIVRTDGTIDLKITPASDPRLPFGPSGIQWMEDGKLAVSGGNSILTMDYSGAIAAQPFASVVNAASLEGVTQLGNGRIAAVEYSTGHLLVFNPKGYRLGGDESDYQVGIGISRPLGITWDNVRDAFMLSTYQAHGDSNYRVTAINHTLKGFTHITVPSLATTSDGAVLQPFGGITALPGENIVAIGTRSPNGIALFDATTGAFLYRYNIPGLASPGGLTYDAKNRLFAVRTAPGGTVKLIARDGTPGSAPDIVNTTIVGTVVLSPTPKGGGISWYKVGAARYFADGDSIYDATTGARVGTPILPSALGLPIIHSVTAITSGPYKGMFAAVNADTSTIVIYSLP